MPSSHYFYILFILFSYFYHIFGLGTQIQAPKIIFLSYSWSYFIHIIFILLDMAGLDPLLNWDTGETARTIQGNRSAAQPKAAAGGQARAGTAAALGPGPGFRAPKCENNMKIIWEKCENNVTCQFHIICTFYSYYFHIFMTFWGSGPRSGPPKSYFCHIPGHLIFILFSYFCICLGWGPCPFRNL